MVPDGYNEIAPGRIAAVVTYLEMTARPEARPAPADRRWTVEQRVLPPLDWYRDLYRRVGQDWLWFSRLGLDDAALGVILHDPLVEVHALLVEGQAEGLFELDWRGAGECKLAFFGVTAALIGVGAGRFLMHHAVARAWSRPIVRFTVNTCTLDHPAALAFYRRAGFTPIGRKLEVAIDPRLTGVLPRSAAPGVPILDP